jgi:hypothetical protein
MTAQAPGRTLVSVALAVVVRMDNDARFHGYVERSMQRP